MDEKQLRQMVREEVESVLNEQDVIDDHPKFRRLVAKQLKRPLAEGEFHGETWSCWRDALTESGGQPVEGEVLSHYVNEAVEQAKAAEPSRCQCGCSYESHRLSRSGRRVCRQCAACPGYKRVEDKR